ncbi:hypothetical protein HYR99_28230 [Candidatus Poribacteria bacterium]|nr:hypothetical protein [Candidatus Poribacteria bacterium]
MFKCKMLTPAVLVIATLVATWLVAAQEKPNDLPQIGLEQMQLTVGHAEQVQTIAETILKVFPDGVLGSMRYKANAKGTLLIFPVTLEIPGAASVWMSEAPWTVRSKINSQIRCAVAIDPGDGLGWSIPSEGTISSLIRRFEKADRTTIRVCFAVPKADEWLPENVELCVAVPIATLNKNNGIARSDGQAPNPESLPGTSEP